MKRFHLLCAIMALGIFVLFGCSGGSSGSSPAASTSTAAGTSYTYTGAVKDMGTGAALPGLTVSVRKASDNSTISSTTVDSSGKYTVTIPANTKVYVHFSGTSGSTAYTPTNTSIDTMTADVTDGDTFPVMSTSEAGDTSGKAWIFLNALDPSGNQTSGATITFSPSVSAYGYWDGSEYAQNLTATTSSSGDPTNVFGYNTTSVTVTATWTKSGMETYTTEYPLIVGEVTYDWNNFTSQVASSSTTTTTTTSSSSNLGACLVTGCGFYGCSTGCEMLTESACNALNGQQGTGASFHAGETCP